MLRHLAGGCPDGPHEQRLARYTRPKLPVLDDFGLEPLRTPGPEALYDVIDERDERASIVLTSNRDRAGTTGKPTAARHGRFVNEGKA